MLTRWPIRNKLLVGITLLLVMVVTLSASGFRGVYAYRGLVKSLRGRADELPLATMLLQQVSDLRATAAGAHVQRWGPELPAEAADLGLSEQFQGRFDAVAQTLQNYRVQLLADEADDRIGDIGPEETVAGQIRLALDRIELLTAETRWGIDEVKHEALNDELEGLQKLAAKLPSHLHDRLAVLADEVRIQYRSLIALLTLTTLAAAALLALFLRLFYRWIFHPLRVLVTGSRQVAAGDFGYRIELASRDEMGELADAMNDMTARFQAIRDDLDRQVQLRTRQVVRSEQLASVGFLAAGVAHEINNPLASIAMCAESLESRLAECSHHTSRDDESTREARELQEDTRTVPAKFTEQLTVMQHYLRMIQTEAFRCKGITEKLLDFSRIGEVKRQNAELRELVEGVIDMVRHLGKYQDRHIKLLGAEPVVAHVNVQEVKQVVLNLITNALDSLDPDGTVEIDLVRSGDKVELIFTDNGCGMTPEVLAHLFEPFFTRRRGGQGTGLGLSIVYRIVTEHGGQIEADSDGPGRGSRFRITLPSAQTAKENHHRYQAA